MIRLATIKNANAIGRSGLRQLFPPPTSSSASLTSAVRFTTARSFSANNDGDKATTIRGIPYSKLTVGVPKERYPLEKRVAATPEVILGAWNI